MNTNPPKRFYVARGRRKEFVDLAAALVSDGIDPRRARDLCTEAAMQGLDAVTCWHSGRMTIALSVGDRAVLLHALEPRYLFEDHDAAQAAAERAARNALADGEEEFVVTVLTWRGLPKLTVN